MAMASAELMAYCYGELAAAYARCAAAARGAAVGEAIPLHDAPVVFEQAKRVKREPTVFNKFVQAELARMKEQGIEGSQTEMFALAAKKWHMSEDNPKNQEKEKKRKHDDPEKKKKKYKKKDDSP
mmetsp:Transcript_8446/g.30123  ORF Transcript_8446/g.30123 Transcript_8446/m.30123 type:complete len:125 (+) Transcript_8446:175-549(+)